MMALALATLGAARAEAQIGWTRHLVGPRARLELRSPESDVRIQAATRLGRRGELRRSVDALLEALGNEEDERVRAAIFAALARRGDDSVVPHFGEHLADWGSEDRAAALRTLGAVGTDRGIPLLIEWLGAADVGDVAVRALARIGAPAVPRLLRALEIPGSASRAASALGAIGDARATAPLARHLERALPSVQIVMLGALGQLGDERAAPTVGRLLSEVSPEVVDAALDALAAIGGPAAGADVAQLADRGTTAQRARALTTLNTLDPAAAAPRLLAAITDPEGPAALRGAAIDALLEAPSEATIEPLGALLADGATAAAAAEALSRVGGDATPVLLSAAQAAPDRALDGALALALARGDGRLPLAVRADALTWIRADETARGETHAALAGDTEVLERLRQRLDSEEASERAAAAWAVTLLGERARALGPVITRRLPQEDSVAFRAFARAALRLNLPIDAAALHTRFWDLEVAPEALELAGANLVSSAPRTRRRLRRALRAGLRSPRPRVRAAAAVALARAGQPDAWRSLVSALEDEHESVRRAAAHALASLREPDAREAIAARARVEPIAPIRDLLDRAASPRGRAQPAISSGDDVLYLRVIAAPGMMASASDLEVDVILPDGRWLRVAALEGGAVFVSGLGSGRAEVQVRLASER